MKKLIICLVMLMALALSACGSPAEKPVETEAPSPEPTTAISVDYDLNKELAELEAKVAELSVGTDNMTQVEMDALASQLLQLWDNELNILWDRYTELLDADAKTEALNEENAWIKDKEDAVKKAGAEYEGGSMQGMVMSDKATSLIRERCYVIAGYIGDIVGQK